MTPSRTSAAASTRRRCPRPEAPAPSRRVAAGLLLLLPPLAAGAHGGPHDSIDVGEGRTDGAPDLATNYGLLVPGEGEDWAWICEEVTGPQGFSAQAQVQGRWFLGSVGGLQASEDGCDWPLVGGGALDGLFVTSVQGDVAVASRLWVTTASGDQDHALWRSEDLGATFAPVPGFEPGATLRGFGQGEGGLPLFVVGWVGTQPTAWISADGAAWSAHPIPPEDVYGVAILGVADGAAWVRLAGLDQDRLARLDPDGALVEALAMGGAITAFDAGPAAGTLHVGGREVGLRTSLDGGESWGPAVAGPAPGCLRTRGDTRLLCADDQADGAALVRAPLAEGDSATWSWTPVVSYGQVRGPLACPADSDVARLCEPLWDVAAPEAGFDAPTVDDTGKTGDTGEAGETGQARAAPDAPVGCCAGRGAGLVLLAPGWLLLRRPAGPRRSPPGEPPLRRGCG